MIEANNLYSQLFLMASKKPEATVFIHSRKKWSYHELMTSCDRAADMFWGLGVRKGDRVAIALKNSPEFVISYFALAKLGAVAVPINFMVSKEDEIGFILKNCHAKGVVTQNEFIKPYSKLHKEIPSVEFLLSTNGDHDGHVGDFWHLLKNADFHIQTQTAVSESDDIVSILYTSGTTGHPKGVLLTHLNLLANARACIHAMNMTEKDVFLCVLPMFHTFSWTTTVLAPMILGSKTLIVSQIIPAKPWLAEMGKEGITVMTAIPQLFSVLAREAKGLKKLYLRYWAFRKMRFCFSGAAPLTSTVQNTFEKTLKVPLLEGYGLTETSPVVSVNCLHSRKHGSVGKAIHGVDIRIISEHDRELGNGQEGEICVKGPNVTKGYHANDQATKEIFTHDGWLKTGDIGIVDEEGFLFIRDRKKDMIIVKGLKVFSAQIELILQEHPSIAEAAVIGVPDSSGDETIKCFCVPKPGSSLDKTELMRFIRRRLDPYKRPREIEITDCLPKNAMHKVLKRVLRQQEIEKRTTTTNSG